MWMSQIDNRSFLRYVGILLGISLIVSTTVMVTPIAIMLAIITILFILESYNNKINLYILFVLIPLPANITLLNLELNLSIPFLLICYFIKLFMKNDAAIMKFNKFDFLSVSFLIIGLLPAINKVGGFEGWLNGYVKAFIIPVAIYFYIRIYYRDYNKYGLHILYAIVTSLIVFSGYALFEFFVLNQSSVNFVGDSEYRLAGGILGQGNGLAMNLEKIIPFILLLVLTSKSNKNNNDQFRKALVLVLVFFASVLFLSLSRGGWASIVILVFMVLLLYKKFFAVIIACILTTISVLVIEPIRTRLFTDESTLFFRTDLWEMSIKIFKENFLFGIPLNDFVYYYEQNFRTVVSLSRSHNILLDILVFTGVVGLLYFSVLFLSVLISAKKGLKNNDDPIKRVIIIGFLFMIITTFIHGQIDSPMFSYSRDVFVWIEFALFSNVLISRVGHNNE
ncbi:O-antigen ligase family protein [Paenibacillus sp. B01]|uniref:O-antigen ligase family protein n=1 Tax=Paenibacillus sp. B01 TaxID=2660554 RepID=UPI00129AB829|nr:O-antigen ligase family protein [Paenibacillus sp. B01]QGG55274.1 hypothetical protein GE073_06560 [Paenibacillus sp. B01]